MDYRGKPRRISPWSVKGNEEFPRCPAGRPAEFPSRGMHFLSAGCRGITRDAVGSRGYSLELAGSKRKTSLAGDATLPRLRSTAAAVQQQQQWYTSANLVYRLICIGAPVFPPFQLAIPQDSKSTTSPKGETLYDPILTRSIHTSAVR